MKVDDMAYVKESDVVKDQYVFEEENSLPDKYIEQRSDEDTEDASETDIMVKQEEDEYPELKDQMYRDKLTSLRKQLSELAMGVHPEYLRRLKRIELNYKDRLRLNDIFKKYELECIEREFVTAKAAAAIEFEEKKVELREALISELEDKKKMIEAEKSNTELASDSCETKPVTTRKLRRRPNDPVPLPEKRRKTLPELNYLLDDNEIMDDLSQISQGGSVPVLSKRQDSDSNDSFVNCYVDEGKLFYSKYWFNKGQLVYCESPETGNVCGVLAAINPNEIWIRRTTNNTKFRVPLANLQKGKCTLKKYT